MKRVYLAVCALVGALVGANLATAERPAQNGAGGVPGTIADGAGAVYCPLFPIGQYSDGTYMFYTELYYDSSTCADPDSGYYVGNAPYWPYYCPQCMTAGFHPTGERSGPVAGGFDGLDEKVSADFRPTFPLASGSTTVLGEQFVEFPVPGTETAHRVKLLRVRVSTAAGDRKPIERVIGLGYEVENVPASAPSLAIPADRIQTIEGASHGYRLILEGQQFLVFLAK